MRVSVIQLRTVALKACWALCLVWLLLSCGRPDLSPDEIARRAGQATAQVQFVHYDIDVEGGPVFIDFEETLSLQGLEGDLIRPDRVRATLRVGAGGLAVIELQAIGIGQEQFLTAPLTGQWERMPPGWGFDPTVLFDPEIGVEGVMTQAQWDELLGDERVGGVRCYHLRGRAFGQDVAPLTGWLIVADEIGIEAWVEQDDFRVRRLRAEEPPQDEGGNPTIWLLEFSAFDEPVTIERPPGF
jgi:lipoprotein LprG